MRAFLTGGTGFIGANLVRLLLKQGYTVRVLVRPTSKLDNLDSLDVEIVTGDLNDSDLGQKMQGCQVLFHVAAHYSLWQAAHYSLYLNNVLGTRNIFAAAQLISNWELIPSLNRWESNKGNIGLIGLNG